MSDQMLLAAVIGPMFLVFGLSFLFYPAVWEKIASEWEKNHFSMMAMMAFSLIFGLFIINMHNVWEWSPYVLITITGWAIRVRPCEMTTKNAMFILSADFFRY